MAAFASIVANTFGRKPLTTRGNMPLPPCQCLHRHHFRLFIVVAIVFGFFVYRRNAPLGVATVIGVIGIVVCMIIGLNWHPIYLIYTVWMIMSVVYIGVASVAPVWILLQPRDYLSSFLLYGMMILAVVGIVGAVITGDAAQMPAFTGFYERTLQLTQRHDPLWQAVICSPLCSCSPSPAALSPASTPWWFWHHRKQLDQRKGRKPIAYGGMLIECALARSPSALLVTSGTSMLTGPPRPLPSFCHWPFLRCSLASPVFGLEALPTPC